MTWNCVLFLILIYSLHTINAKEFQIGTIVRMDHFNPVPANVINYSLERPGLLKAHSGQFYQEQHCCAVVVQILD